VKRNTGHLFQRKLFRSDPSILLSYALVSVAVLSGLSLTMDSALTAELCPYAKFYGPSLYSLFKTIVYLVLGVRIWISFKGSMYAYRTRNLLVWGALLSLWTLSTVIAGNLTVTSSTSTENGGAGTKCIVNPSTLYIASQALLDLCAGVVNCVLFVLPICKLYKLSADAAGDDREANSEALKIKAVAYRQCFLSMAAILSSLISMAGIGALTDYVAAFVAFDMFVSTVSVILMYKWNASFTNKLLCCCVVSEKSEASPKATAGNDNQQSVQSGTSGVTETYTQRASTNSFNGSAATARPSHQNSDGIAHPTGQSTTIMPSQDQLEMSTNASVTQTTQTVTSITAMDP